ncbi:hypothetical protein [Agromyces larvae]|uniref:Bacterial spore germination immunoglobulin-like domain-containing protein n=1 Tax=Agromyces larvae TaxID=2929802 RepID=A0ABY4BX46_9MICO|nr:hypothetical protein [Agromyces larvae]UOE43790.1 hypothetical protein MTO99_16705 [Agromyces larvae]
MIRHIRRATTLLVAAGITSALAGCAAPFAVSLPSQAPDTQSSVRPPESDAATIIVAADGFTVIADDDTALLEAAYDDPLDAVVERLAAVLGEEPVVGDDPGHAERPPYTTYGWGGFRLGTAHETSDLAFDVLASGPATGDVEVRTAEGIAIGSSTNAVRTTYPATIAEFDDFLVAHGPDVVVGEAQDPPRTLTVAVYIDAPAQGVTRIFAPVDSYGP